MRTIAGVLLAGSVVAFFVGLVNFSGHVQVGGDQGFILRGWLIVIGSVVLAVGALGFLGSYDEAERIMWRRAALPLALMLTAGVILVAFGETPQDFCGQVTCP